MRTLQILSNVYDAVSNNPSCLSQLPYADIADCVLSSLVVKKDIYPDSQYSLLESQISELLVSLADNIKTNNVHGFTEILNVLMYICEAMPDSEFISSQLEEMNYWKTYTNHLKNKSIVIIGDSHANFFSGNETLTYKSIGNGINICPVVNGENLSVIHVGPCLAYNVNKAESSQHFKEKFEFIEQNLLMPNDTIVFALGEIDIRVHVKKQSELQNKAPEEIIDSILAEYVSFLQSCCQKGYKVYVWGPIASQPDNAPYDPNFPRSGSEMERNRFTAYFSEKIKERLQNTVIHFVTIFNSMIDEDYQTKNEFLSVDSVHLSQTAKPLAAMEFKKAGLPIFQH